VTRSERDRLIDIKEALDRIAHHVAQELTDEELLLDALLYQLLVIGEAVKHLDADTRRRAPGVPWDKIAGLRDVIAHEYFRIDLMRIREIVDRELPALDAAVTELLDT
jgi:uncharacterized protein with HEPN domain